MNNTYKFFIILAVFLSMTIAGNVYATETFSNSLGYGHSGAEVIKLQQFLVDQGFLKSSLVTGRFLSLTKKAVMEFQKSNGIDTTGFFGPLSRAAANKKVVTKPTVKATVAIVSVMPDLNTAGLVMSNSKNISWQTTDYPVGVGININLLRKISDNPASYTLVEKIAQDTKNDGSETWIPKSNQTGSDLYLEITCSTTYGFSNGCLQTGAPIKAF